MLSPELIWFLVGLALILSEFQIPGVILVFFGIGAWVAAITTWTGMTPSLALQLWVFAGASLLLLVLLRRYVKSRFLGHISASQDPGVNMDEFIGTAATVTEDIGPESEGRVEYKGAEWTARTESGQSLPAGSPVIIRRVDGISLVVDPRDKP